MPPGRLPATARCRPLSSSHTVFSGTFHSSTSTLDTALAQLAASDLVGGFLKTVFLALLLPSPWWCSQPAPGAPPWSPWPPLPSYLASERWRPPAAAFKNRPSSAFLASPSTLLAKTVASSHNAEHCPDLRQTPSAPPCPLSSPSHTRPCTRRVPPMVVAL